MMNATAPFPAVLRREPIVPLLHLDGLAYRADGRAILEGVDLEVREGEIHALLGANGSGKTMLARITHARLMPDEAIDLIVTGILR